MDENQKVLYDLLKEVRDDQKKDSEKITKTASTVSKIEGDLEVVKAETAINTRHMGKHMYRTDLLEQLHIDNQKRIENLEEDSKKKDTLIQQLQTQKEAKAIANSWVKDNIKWIVTVLAAVAGIVSKVAGLW